MGRAVFPQGTFEMSEMRNRSAEGVDRRANQAQSDREISVSSVSKGLHGISRDSVCAQTNTTWAGGIVVTWDMQRGNHR